MFEPPEYNEKYTAAICDLFDGILEHLQGFGTLQANTAEADALVTMAGTAFRRLVTVKELIQTERIADASVLVRSMLELLFSGAYIATAPAAEQNPLGRRFFAFEEVQRHRGVKGMFTLIALVSKNPAVEQALGDAVAQVDDTEAQQTKLDFPGIESSPYWCGLPIKKMIAGIHETSTSALMNALYSTMYSALSNFAHPNPVGVKHSIFPVSHYGATALVGMPLMAAMSTLMLYTSALKVCGHSEVPDEPPEALSRFFVTMMGQAAPDESMMLRVLTELAAKQPP